MSYRKEWSTTSSCLRLPRTLDCSTLMNLLPKYLINVIRISADERGRKNRYKLPVPGVPEAGPNILHIFLYFSIVSLSVSCTNCPFQTKSQSLCNCEFFRFNITIFRRSALAAGPKKKFFTGPELPLGGPGSDSDWRCFRRKLAESVPLFGPTLRLSRT